MILGLQKACESQRVHSYFGTISRECSISTHHDKHELLKQQQIITLIILVLEVFAGSHAVEVPCCDELGSINGGFLTLTRSRNHIIIEWIEHVVYLSEFRNLQWQPICCRQRFIGRRIEGSLVGNCGLLDREVGVIAVDAQGLVGYHLKVLVRLARPRVPTLVEICKPVDSFHRHQSCMEVARRHWLSLMFEVFRRNDQMLLGNWIFIEQQGVGLGKVINVKTSFVWGSERIILNH